MNEIHSPISNTIVQKLFTGEDKFNVHKTLGLICLTNFIYRYSYWLLYGTLGYETTTFMNTFTISAHMALSSTSLFFHVLSRRLKMRPLIIYKEYQLHTILFTFRSVIWYFAPKFYKGLDILPIGLLVIHLLVDVVSHFYGTEGMTTVRVQNKSKNVGTILFRRLFSYYQILATATLLSATEFNAANTSFNLLIAIQSSTFLMTLVRKNLIRPYTHLAIYGFCLFLSTAHMWQNYDISVFIGALIVFLLRMQGINKYVLWVSFYFIRAYSDNLTTFFGQRFTTFFGQCFTTFALQNWVDFSSIHL
jgi:hypothetical protein